MAERKPPSTGCISNSCAATLTTIVSGVLPRTPDRAQFSTVRASVGEPLVDPPLGIMPAVQSVHEVGVTPALGDLRVDLM